MKREIITLCGSTRFMNEFKEIEKELTKKGKIVLPPAIYGKSEGIEYDKELEKTLFELHLDKIRMSHSIFVLNVNNYIGDSTKKEINLALALGKKVYYYTDEGGIK